MSDELTVWWNGRPGHYLCVTEPEPVNLEHVKAMTLRQGLLPRALRPYRSRQEMRSLILRTLAEQGAMPIKVLRLIVDPRDPHFYNVVTRMTDQGLLDRPSKGVVGLKRRPAPQRKAEP